MGTNKYGACLRKVSNWSKVKKEHKFESNAYDRDIVLEHMPVASPKMEAMLRKIEELDKKDMKEHGKLFKHFIFSEVNQGGYGGKIITSALIASGKQLCYEIGDIEEAKGKKKARQGFRMLSEADLKKTKGNNFALLSSVNIFKKSMPVRFKKELLAKYNSRPDNVYGDQIRFIIMDAGFKEGIDLFDVKYVHIFEPQTSKADEKQVIGRATRTCGQKGLPFHPKMGWPLYVFMYDVSVPNILKKEGAITEDTLFQSYLKASQIDVSQLFFASELENLAVVGSVDYELNKNIHNFKVDIDDEGEFTFENSDTQDGFSLFGGKKQGGVVVTKQPKKKTTNQGKAVVSCAGVCGKRPTRDIPASIPVMALAYYSFSSPHLMISPPAKKEGMRLYFCRMIKKHADLCSRVNEVMSNPNAFIKKYAKAIHYNFDMNTLPLTKMQKNALQRYIKYHYKHKAVETEYEVQKAKLIKNAAAANNAVLVINSPSGKKNAVELGTKPGAEEAIENKTVPMKRMDFLQTREYVAENFSEFAWEKVKLENMCVDKPRKEGEEPVQKKAVAISYTPTQDFIRHFFTPSNPVKGMLLHHSVGTGKSCTAIADASDSFETEGYTILWVTRTTLKSDIWKNMFSQVCHTKLMNALESIPGQHRDQVRLLSKSWKIRPMSYKQFNNMVKKRNQQYKELIKINGEEDPLHKTLLIIDEAHKLYGGQDLSSIEKPNMEEVYKVIQNSYAVSGKDSVRLLLMTATPITNDPMEFIKLLNLLREEKDKLPEDYETFANTYLNAEGSFRKKMKLPFLNKIAGYYSYLNRERDARQFSQPIVQYVYEDMSRSKLLAVEDYEEMYKSRLNEYDKELESILQEKVDRKDMIMRDAKARAEDIKSKFFGEERVYQLQKVKDWKANKIAENNETMKERKKEVNYERRKLIKEMKNEIREDKKNDVSLERAIDECASKFMKSLPHGKIQVTETE